MSRFLPITAALVAVVACSDSTGPSELSVARLVGTWDLTRLELVRVADQSVAQNLKADYGLQAIMAIRSGGTGTLVFWASDQSRDSSEFTIALRGDTVFYNADNSSSFTARVTLTGRTMTWLAVESYETSFDGGATQEEVLERDVWQRR